MSQREPVRERDDRLVIHNLITWNPHDSFATDVRRGLTSTPKRLSPKYFYDQLGSQLFEAICLLPEYYLTRAENEILQRYAREIVSSVPNCSTLMEMGSGSASKTQRLIEALLRNQRELNFIPVDISVSALESSSRILLQSHPGLRIEAYAADYFVALAHLSRKRRGPTLALFLGSNISNFEEVGAYKFLQAMRSVLRAGDALLLGADLRKDRKTLEAAYDDSLGVTAAFNLNLLERINRELHGDFDLHAFRHRSFYNEAIGRVEIYIESTREQTVRIEDLGLEIQLALGEQIHTENSYKYEISGIRQLALKTGFKYSRTWLDSREQFSSNLLLATS